MFETVTFAASVGWFFTPWGLGAILAVVLFFDSEVPARIVRSVRHRSGRRSARRLPAAPTATARADARTGVPAA
jgi:hypothetical protein